MPFRKIPGTDQGYWLLSVDKDGVERNTDPDGQQGLLSKTILARAAADKPSHLFFFSHGWKGDVPAAIAQYDRWLAQLLGVQTDSNRFSALPTGFRPMLVGLHWPSLPWGDDELGSAGGQFGEETGPGLPEQKRRYIERLGGGKDVEQALDVIFEEARVNAAAEELPQIVIDAYLSIDRALKMAHAGEGAPPGDDGEPFDPVASFQTAQAETAAVGFGGIDLGGILSPLRNISFWQMKKRARAVGESGMRRFVQDLQQAGPARTHLMGHSFGCIVISSILSGALPRPVDSAVLVQGAMSIWSYAPTIALADNKPGYFNSVLTGKAVQGPIVTTRSRFDKAVGTFYPLAAGVARQVDFAGEEDLPKYGGIGSFGLQGVTGLATNGDIAAVGTGYGFARGKIYNLECSSVICEGDGASGAHSDIAKPEVAHIIWEAARAAEGI